LERKTLGFKNARHAHAAGGRRHTFEQWKNPKHIWVARKAVSRGVDPGVKKKKKKANTIVGQALSSQNAGDVMPDSDVLASTIEIREKGEKPGG